MDATQEQEPNDEEWAEENGIPHFDEPFIQRYLAGRDRLIDQERLQRSDHAFRQALSPMAAEASAIVSAIRFEEQQTLWNREYEDNLAKEEGVDIFPGMMFSLAKDRMERSKLWQIVKKMPKGALLHCHLAAMGDLEHLIRQALETEGFCVSADTPLTTTKATETAGFSFRYVPTANAEGAILWSKSYESDNWIPIGNAAESYPDGGREGFIKCLISRITMSTDDSLRHHLGINEIWRKFTSCFQVTTSLIRYEPLFRVFIRDVLSQLHEDGIRWVDIRSDFVAPFYRTGSSEPDVGFEGLFTALEEEIEAFQNSEEGNGFWGERSFGRLSAVLAREILSKI